MRIEEIMFEDHELINLIGQYKPINESYQVLMEEIQDKVAKAAQRYNSKEPPETIILQANDDPNLHVVFLSGDNKHAVIKFLNGRIVEEGQLNDFQEVIAARNDLVNQGYEKVDSRSWYKRNWKMILAAFVGGAVSISIMPLLVSALIWIATTVAPLASYLGLGSAVGASAGGAVGGGAGLGKLALGGAGAVGFARLIDKLKGNV